MMTGLLTCLVIENSEEVTPFRSSNQPMVGFSRIAAYGVISKTVP